ncbi:MAG: hypothetical protein U0931_17930 [Vulcanimicrobiota bacterium]
MRNFLIVLLLSAALFLPALALPEQAQRVWEMARSQSRWWEQAGALHPEVVPTRDGNSFFLVWRPVEHPRAWIVSLHGVGMPARGFASDDLVAWQPHLQDSQLGLICLQWWLGGERFFDPTEIDGLVQSQLSAMKVAPGQVMLHGFSRGATQTYALAAMDAARPHPSYALVVANAGGMSPDYPPNRALQRGDFGPQPLRSTRWVTVAGFQDPNPERDGVAGMRRTGQWLTAQGGQLLLAIEDPQQGHGAFHRSRANCRQVLDLFRSLLVQP